MNDAGMNLAARWAAVQGVDLRLLHYGGRAGFQGAGIFLQEVLRAHACSGRAPGLCLVSSCLSIHRI